MNHISVCSNEPLKSSKMRTSAARILVLTLTMAVLGMSVSCGNSVSSDVKNSVIDDALAVAEANGKTSLGDQIEIVTLCSYLEIDPAHFGLYRTDLVDQLPG